MSSDPQKGLGTFLAQLVFQHLTSVTRAKSGGGGAAALAAMTPHKQKKRKKDAKRTSSQPAVVPFEKQGISPAFVPGVRAEIGCAPGVIETLAPSAAKGGTAGSRAAAGATASAASRQHFEDWMDFNDVSWADRCQLRDVPGRGTAVVAAQDIAAGETALCVPDEAVLMPDDSCIAKVSNYLQQALDLLWMQHQSRVVPTCSDAAFMMALHRAIRRAACVSFSNFTRCCWSSSPEPCRRGEIEEVAGLHFVRLQ